MSYSYPRGTMPPGLPGWRRAACLGCTEVVSEARPPWVVIAGSRDGAHLFAFPTGPERGASTFDPYEPPPDVLILGVAHEACRERAAERLRKREISLASAASASIIRHNGLTAYQPLGSGWLTIHQPPGA